MENVARKKLIQEYYSKRSMDYDRQKSRTWNSGKGFADEVFEELFSGFAGFPGRNVLEIGVGTGRNAVPLLKKVSLRFVGLDLSREMLKLAEKKTTSLKLDFEPVLGDAEDLPLMRGTFDALICVSTMHYFSSQDKVLRAFADLLKRKGTLVCGDLTVHESDEQGFFEGLERMLSKAHARYCKPSEMRMLIESAGFRVVKMKTIVYRKAYDSLIEDKGVYFGVAPQMLHEYVEGARMDARRQYDLTNTDLALYYTIITATLDM
jgi:ubiquinone/menaquinone biosynthesis C-methylase UbiE